MENYYQILEVSKTASTADIKKAYRRLAMKYHPDRNANDKSAEEHFKKVKEAYEVLSDDKKRAIYDQYGAEGLNAHMGGGAGGAGFAGAGGFGDIFGDIFEHIFTGGGPGRAGAGRARSRAQQGADLGYGMELTLEQAAKGASIEIQVPSWIKCKECEGSGAKKGSSVKTCESCTGEGVVRIQQGFFSVQQTCPECHGEGKVISDPCVQCHGQGRVREHKKLLVKIPAGVDTGDRIRLAGEGEAGFHGGPPGDLYVQVTIKEHPLFKRRDNNLLCDVPINFTAAALGGELEVPTLEGKVSLKIPPETQSGKIFRLRGKGVKSVRGHGVGDLLCTVHVETPVNLSQEQRELLEKFQHSLEVDGKTHSPKTVSWFAGVKKFFEDMRVNFG